MDGTWLESVAYLHPRPFIHDEYKPGKKIQESGKIFTRYIPWNQSGHPVELGNESLIVTHYDLDMSNFNRLYHSKALQLKRGSKRISKQYQHGNRQKQEPNDLWSRH